MNKYTYNYKCYNLGEFIFGVLNLNSDKDEDTTYKNAIEYLNENLENRGCVIKLDNKTKTNEIKENAKHITYCKLPISYAAK